MSQMFACRYLCLTIVVRSSYNDRRIAHIEDTEWPLHVQLIEVTPDKKVVWALRDWVTLGPASSTQLLDEPGIPEKGEQQR
jgi:hypothetical protein